MRKNFEITNWSKIPIRGLNLELLHEAQLCNPLHHNHLVTILAIFDIIVSYQSKSRNSLNHILPPSPMFGHHCDSLLVPECDHLYECIGTCRFVIPTFVGLYLLVTLSSHFFRNISNLKCIFLILYYRSFLSVSKAQLSIVNEGTNCFGGRVALRCDYNNNMPSFLSFSVF